MAPQAEIITIDGGLQIDFTSRSVTYRGEAVIVSATEYRLLTRLAQDPRRVWTKAELLSEIWGHRSVGTTRTLDSHACRLRSKLHAVGGRRYVHNTRGVGYSLVTSTHR